MADELRFCVEMIPAGLFRWGFVIVWSDGLHSTSVTASWGFRRTMLRAHRIAQEARRG